MLALGAAGCGGTASTLAGAVVMPDFVIPPPPYKGSSFYVNLHTTSTYACGELYCFATGGTTASGYDNHTEPSLMLGTRTVQVSADNWTWRLEAGGVDYVRDVETLVVQNPKDACEDLPDGFLDGTKRLPARTRNLACAMTRVHQLMTALVPARKLPPVDITTLLVPFGRSVKKFWRNSSPDTVQLHYLFQLPDDGHLSMGLLGQLLGHELTHALSYAPIRLWGERGEMSDPRKRLVEEQRAFTIGACAEAAVWGRNYKTTWAVESDYAALGSSITGGQLGDRFKNVVMPIETIAEQAFVDSYKAANGGSADYDGGDPRQVAALFGVCREMATTQN